MKAGASMTVRYDLHTSVVGAQSVVWRASRYLSYESAVIEKTLGAGVTIADAINGLVDVRLDAADTAALTGVFTHELRVVDVDGDVAFAYFGAALPSREYFALFEVEPIFVGAAA